MIGPPNSDVRGSNKLVKDRIESSRPSKEQFTGKERSLLLGTEESVRNFLPRKGSLPKT